MKIIECEQLSPEWWEARCGLPTASEFHRVMTPVKWEPSKAQEDYACELAGEILLGVDPTVFSDQGTLAMRHGRDTEAQARSWYAIEKGYDPGQVRRIGFCTSDCGRYGASPDGMIVGDPAGPGGLELKCPQRKTHISYALAGTLPTEYKVQVHGQLVVTGWKWVDFMSYYPDPKLPALIVRVFPDKYTEALADELDRFCRKKDSIVARLRAAN